jgi:HEPN domain-containing protein
MNRGDLQMLGEERLADAQLLLANGRYGAAYYISGCAIECGLKACIAKRTQAEEFYDKNLAKNIFKHDLVELASYARFAAVVDQLKRSDPNLERNWAQVCQWSEESRYEAHTPQEATQMIEAVADPAHGVLQCISQFGKETR